MTDPVILLIKSIQCPACHRLAKKWDESVSAMKEVQPSFRVVEVICVDNRGLFDETKYPKSLSKFTRWFPMVLLIPGRIWDNAMSNLNTPLGMSDGIQVMGGKWDEKLNTFEPEKQMVYDIGVPSHFAKWLAISIQNETFKNMSKQIRPLLSSVPRSNIKASNIQIDASDDKRVIMNQRCTMNLISRPK